MTIRSLAHLEAFYWVVRLGSFHAAARRLGITQPAVSVRLRELERSLGTRLVERATPARLTREGVAALDYAGRILSLVQDLDGRMRPRKPLRGTLRFGVSDGFALVCLARFMAVIRDGNAGLRIAITVANSPVLSRMLEARELDAAILSNSRVISGLHLEAIGVQEIAWVASPQLGLLGPVQPEHLLQQQIFTNPAPSHLFTVIMDWFAGCGLTPSGLSECDSVAVIATLVTAGAGISLLPLCIVERELAAGKLARVAVQPPCPDQEIVVAFTSASERTRLDAVVQAVGSAVADTAFLTRPTLRQ